MLCKGNLAHGCGKPWCLAEAGDDGLCPAHRQYPLYRPGSRGSMKANRAAANGDEQKPRRRRSTKNPDTKGEDS